MTLLHPFRSSLVVRSATIIAVALCLAGSLFAFIATGIATRQAHAQIGVHIEELVGAIENTASIACFLGDRGLGKEVVQGLLKNRIVERVTIFAGGRLLSAGTRGLAVDRAEPDETGPGLDPPVVRVIYSPFNPKERIGEIVLIPNRDEVRTQVAEFTRFVLLLLLGQVVMVAIIAIVVVFNLVTRPIKQVSDRIHSVAAERGERLQAPRGHAGDEIGRLVSDVNSLIGRVVSLLHKEQNLRVERETESRKLQTIFENAETGIFLVDGAGALLSFNRAFRALFGVADEALAPGAANTAALFGASGDALRAMIARCVSERRAITEDFRLSGADPGRERWIEVILNPVQDGVLQGVANDVTQRQRKQEAAQLLAMRDALTGVANRLGFERRFSRMLADYAGERGRAGALMLIDLDCFKEVNDVLGHDAGDAVLIEVARRLESLVRQSDLVARLGGDEFVVLLDAIEGRDKLARIAALVVDKLKRPVDLAGGRQARVGASVGIAMFVGQESAAPEILKRADGAMYMAKRAGKNTYRFDCADAADQTGATAAPVADTVAHAAVA